MAFAQIDHRPSHAFGTGLSIGVHLLIFSVLLFTAIQSPSETATPNVSVALLAPNFTRPGSPGRPGGSGMQAAAERTQTRDAAKRGLAPSEAPQAVKPPDVSVPAMIVDAPALLPGSAIDIDAIGRGLGPGAGSDRGSGVAGAGAGAGPGRDGGFGGDGPGSGDGATSPQLIREVRPGYTVEAMRAKVQGRVELEVVVLPDGTVDPKQIRMIRSLDSTFGLDAQAIEAVKQWRFRPGRQNGRPVPVRVTVELTFTLR